MFSDSSPRDCLNTDLQTTSRRQSPRARFWAELSAIHTPGARDSGCDSAAQSSPSCATWAGKAAADRLGQRKLSTWTKISVTNLLAAKFNFLI